jgi:hypothetical protein
MSSLAEELLLRTALLVAASATLLWIVKVAA